MFREKLEPYVQEKYGLSVYEFMKQKVETESLSQYEIADLLNLDVKKVGRLSRRFGLKKKNGFKRRFNQKYGTDAVATFKQMVEDPHKSLSEVGRHFGFTREYARQVYEKLYGFPYSVAYQKKLTEKRTRKVGVRRKPKMSYLCEVMKKLSSMGIDAHILREDYLYRIGSNGFRLDVRISTKPLCFGGKRFFRIAYGKDYIADCDFVIFICVSGENRVHFIIPHDFVPKSGICLFPQAGPGESKYTKFQEAWSLLKLKK